MTTRNSTTITILIALLGLGLAGCGGGGASMQSGMQGAPGSPASPGQEPDLHYSFGAPGAFAEVEPKADPDEYTLTITKAGEDTPRDLLHGEVTGDGGDVLAFDIGVLREDGYIDHDQANNHITRSQDLDRLNDPNGLVFALVDTVPAGHPMANHLDYLTFGYWMEPSQTPGVSPAFGGVFYGGSPAFSLSAGESVLPDIAEYRGHALGHYKSWTVQNGSFTGTMELTARFSDDASFEMKGNLGDLAVYDGDGNTVPPADYNNIPAAGLLPDGTVSSTGYAGTWTAAFFGRPVKTGNYYAPPPAVAGEISFSSNAPGIAEGVHFKGAYGAYRTDENLADF